ncbi:MAG: VanZ family protein [Chitinophagaceae bacterium]
MKSRILFLGILIAYSALLIKIMVLKDVPLIRVGMLRLNFGGTLEGTPNFIPFKTIGPYLLGDKGWIIAGINLVGNIILLVPVGFLLPFVYRKFNWKIILPLAAATGLIIEGAQVLLHVGIFDIDDVLLNGVGVLVGFWTYFAFQKLRRSRLARPVAIAGFLLVLSSGIFIAYSFITDHQLPFGFEPAVVHSSSSPVRTTEHRSPSDCPNCDLCQGTGGIGPIVKLGNHTLTVRRRDGILQTIELTSATTIKTSAGVAQEADLKIGDRVTLIVDKEHNGMMVASAVLVCQPPQADSDSR